MSFARRPVAAAALAAVTAVAVTACSSGGSDDASSAATTRESVATSTGGAPSSNTPSHASSSSARPTTTPAPANSCVQRTYERLSPAQRAGQLLMIGLDANAASTADDSLIAEQHVGNVIYLGGWTGRSKIQSTSNHLQSEASSSATGGVGMLIAADQEGGAVQQLRGPGFSTLVSALQQGTMSSSARTAYATTIGRQLKAAGVNLDLAPVSDTVPASMAASNAPIGKYAREYGHAPATVAAAVGDVVRGLDAGGVGATVKHFPGLGRITGNTDYTSVGTTDTVTTATDPYLRPFSAGMKAGAAAVMIASAHYAKLDPSTQATFSGKVITGLLRGTLGWHGVVVTDDMNAVAVSGIPVGERAVRFVAAGGDIVLTGRAANASPMIGAILARAGSDAAFAAKVTASVQRVLTLKRRLGLLHC
ncbi:glycoside hydrolase family 3 N-terminal domain-containing protein [Flexivirga oryzae]|uniref:beta-N-acetylhexosaminidase n=1 Tax=Flexivirga oryzae TaxID=1794944 RepID=A0A839NCE1_9MICO|nr:beta-N-acetylhexosaminidase [Flexivirga oryzae]